MSKYATLGRHLKEQARDTIPMTFTEVERVLGTELPPSAYRHRAWWSNNPENNVATREWLDAGFETERVDIEQQRLVFRRRSPLPRIGEPVAPAWKTSRRAVMDSEAPEMDSLFGGHHPLFGALKGTVYIPPGVDLTEPADPEWGKIWDEDEHGDE